MHVKSLASTQHYSYQFTIMMQMITVVPGSLFLPFLLHFYYEQHSTL